MGESAAMRQKPMKFTKEGRVYSTAAHKSKSHYGDGGRGDTQEEMDA